MEATFGRTNQAFPENWVSLSPPPDPNGIADLVGAVTKLRCPIDVSSQPGLWGQYLREAESPLVAFGGQEIERATSQEHASDLVQANLIELLTSVGRLQLDFYFVKVARTLQEVQIVGALAALEAARHDGHVRFLGLAVTGSPTEARAVWQFHDAFEAIAMPWDASSNDPGGLVALAKSRRVGVLTIGGDRNESYGQCRLYRVRTLEDVARMEAVAA